MADMQYTQIPFVDKKVSRILFGTASEPFLKGEDENALLDVIYAEGVNTFDTARVYGLSEQSLGSWIAARGLRRFQLDAPENCRSQRICGPASASAFYRIQPELRPGRAGG